MATRKKEPRKEKDKTPVAVPGDVQIPKTPEVAEQFLEQVPAKKTETRFPIVSPFTQTDGHFYQQVDG